MLLTLVCALLLVPYANSAATSAGSATSRGSSGPFEFRPGVIVAPAMQAVYLMKPGGGIDAIDLGSGRPIWTATVAAKPLLLHGQLLISQAETGGAAGTLRIVGLDAKAEGRPLWQSDITLPSGVAASVDDGLGATFRTSARARDGDAIISWSYAQARASDIAPPPHDETQRTEVAGAARIELRTGHVQPLDAGVSASEPAGLPERLARLVASGDLPIHPWRAESFFSVIAPESPSKGLVTIKRWSAGTGDPLPDITISTDGSTIRYPSADGKLLLASRLEGVDPAGSEDYLWSIFSLETGEQIVQLHNGTPGAWFCLSGSSLIHEVRPIAQVVAARSEWDPPMLRAVDLKTSHEIWARPFRDTAYRGPYPSHGRQSAPPGSGGTGSSSQTPHHNGIQGRD